VLRGSLTFELILWSERGLSGKWLFDFKRTFLITYQLIFQTRKTQFDRIQSIEFHRRALVSESINWSIGTDVPIDLGRIGRRSKGHSIKQDAELISGWWRRGNCFRSEVIKEKYSKKLCSHGNPADGSNVHRPGTTGSEGKHDYFKSRLSAAAESITDNVVYMTWDDCWKGKGSDPAAVLVSKTLDQQKAYFS